MIADPRAAPDPRQPEVEEARLAKTGDHADAMRDQGEHDDPGGTEDQEQFGRDHRVGDEPGVSDTGEHLRARERHKHGVTFEPVQRSVTEGSGRLNARHDAGRAKQDEAA